MNEMQLARFENEVQKLDENQKVYFMWLCAIRLIPFLGINAVLNYWEYGNRCNYLYSILLSLDICIYSTNSLKKINCNNIVDEYKLFDFLYKAEHEARKYSEKINGYQYIVNASNAAMAASMVAKTTNLLLHYVLNCTTKNDDVIEMIDSYMETYQFGSNATTDRKNSYDMIINFDVDKNVYSSLMEDLRSISEGNYRFKTNTRSFGDIWTNFLKAMDSESLSEWALLYQKIFDNNFQVNNQIFLENIDRLPIEIQKKGALEVTKYLKVMREYGTEVLNEARIIILGDKGAGKTCLARKLINPNALLTNDSDSTAGVDSSLWVLSNVDMNVHIWDFAGHTVTHAVHQFFLSEKCLYIIVCNGRTEDNKRLTYWLDHMKNYGGNSKAIILVNKHDNHTVDLPQYNLADKYPIINYCEFSLKDDVAKLKKFRIYIQEYLKNNPAWSTQIIPKNYYLIKKKLEKLFIDSKNKECVEYISLENFRSLVGDIKIDNLENLLNYLHTLGISLWYKNIPGFDTLILNPEWISHAVYKVINWVHEEKKYSITLSEFSSVFKNDLDRFPRDKYIFIYKLMLKYELAYEIESSNCLIIPHLLKEDRPKDLPQFLIGESLMLRYISEQPLPSNTISRFIVRHNQQIKNDNNYLVWRFGVVLEDDNGNIALVKEEDRSINVYVKGKRKGVYLDVLRTTLDVIFDTYKSVSPELQCRVERYGLIDDFIESKHPLWLSEDQIKVHVKDEVPYYDYQTRKLIDLKETASKYNIRCEKIDQLIISTVENQTNYQLFHEYNEDLQRALNELLGALDKINPEDDELVNDIRKIEEIASGAEICTTAAEAHKNGVLEKIHSLLKKFADEKSALHKTVKGLRFGAGIIKDVAKSYNLIAQLLDLPALPSTLFNNDSCGVVNNYY